MTPIILVIPAKPTENWGRGLPCGRQGQGGDGGSHDGGKGEERGGGGGSDATEAKKREGSRWPTVDGRDEKTSYGKDGSGRGGGENEEGGRRGGCGAPQQRRREATGEKATTVPSREATGDGNGGKRRGSWGMRGRCHGENGRGRWWSATRTGRRKKGRGRWAVLLERKQGGKGDREAAVDDEGRQGRSRAAAEEKGRGRNERRWTAVDPAMTVVLAMEKEVAGRHRSSGGRRVTSERQPGEWRKRKKRGFRSLP